MDPDPTGMNRPCVAVSMGDPAGISPEIVAQSLDAAVRVSRPLVFGHWPTFEQALSRYTPSAPVDVVREMAPPKEGRVTFYPCGDSGDPIISPGERCARAQLEALERAVDAVLTDRFGAVVTAPVSKTQVAMVLPSFSGHTEYLARRAGLQPDDVTMVFASEGLFVGLLSTHIALRDAADAVTPARLSRTYRHLIEMLASMQPGRKPRIAVAGLNPHAGEGGLFGNEEQEIFMPFCEALREKGEAEVAGPLSADAVYRDAVNGRYDGVVAAYHDQAMIPLKLAGLGQMVNVTMGLPFVRTSPDHGVAYDIARTGKADPGGFRFALELAVRMLAARTDSTRNDVDLLYSSGNTP